MLKYSVVIPTYGRTQYLKGCLESISVQTIKPQDIFIIDNNTSPSSQRIVEDTVESCSANGINFVYKKGSINSGAVARNVGASLVSTELVAFLDDDVLVDCDYYENVLDVFEADDQVVGVQGVDRDFVEGYKANISGSYIQRLFLFIENFLEHASIVRGTTAELRPSLAVTHPAPDKDFVVESQWVSTCAGVFRTELFNVIEFPKNFVKYSWNEYVFFSYSIFKKKLGKMIYTSGARYRNVITDAGRMPLRELVYMAEVYDLYVYSHLFDRSWSNRLIYIKSRIGRVVFAIARMLYRRDFHYNVLTDMLGAFRLAYSNRNEIRSGNFDCYNKQFPLE